jgi:putative SOS response-associated peptidase YedK
VNADEYAIMKHMHRAGDEKRSVLILHPDNWEEWLTTPNIEAARAMLQLYSVEDMAAVPAMQE